MAAVVVLEMLMFVAFGLTVSEKQDGDAADASIYRDNTTNRENRGNVYNLLPQIRPWKQRVVSQLGEFRYLGDLVTEDGKLTHDINRRSLALRACLKKFFRELFGRQSAPWIIYIRVLNAEAMEGLLYGCMAWAPRHHHYPLFRTTHHRLVLRVIGYRHVRCTY